MLARTLITGITTLFVLVALLVLGGESIAPFSIALIVGIIVGTYSSIYTASATCFAALQKSIKTSRNSARKTSRCCWLEQVAVSG